MIRSLSGNSLTVRLPSLHRISPIPLPHSSPSQPPHNLDSTVRRSKSMDSLDKSASQPDIPEEAMRVVESLAAEWTDVPDVEALQVIPLKGAAVTNEVYQIRWITNPNRKVLVRIYGAGVEAFFNREDEIRTFEFMSNQGCGPRLLARFPNGRVEEFLSARTLTAPDLRDPETSALIATKLKEFHKLDVPGPKTTFLWDRLRNWVEEAKRLCPPEDAEEFHLNVLEEEISMLQKNLWTHQQHVGFCHNDLQCANIMMDEETGLLTIIDYEYASYNPVAFDIANHFCEMTAIHDIQAPHVLDVSKYPNLEEQERFVRIYLSGSDNKPSDSEVKKLLEEVEKYTLASHLLWGLWGIISQQVNKIEFEYKEFGRQKFQLYWENKSRLLKL